MALGCFVLLACNGTAGRGSGGGGSADAGTGPLAALSFDIDPGLACADGGLSGICVAPSQTVTFLIDGTIDGPVSLSLEGNYADAALVADDVTISGGHAQVTLQVASVPVEFNVVARDKSPANRPAASVAVLVSKAGIATIEATPSYSGHRPTPTFFATDYVHATCAEVAAFALEPDAGASWTSAPGGIPIALSVVAGDHVALDVRVGHYASGCIDLSPLVPGSTTAISVPIYDVPMALADTNLSATFSFTTVGSPATDGGVPLGWPTVAGATASGISASFFEPTMPLDGGAPSDGPTLLSAMMAAIASAEDQSDFSRNRASGAWDAAATMWLQNRGATIEARALQFLDAAVNLGPQPLVMHIGSGENGAAPVTPVTFGGTAAGLVGLGQPGAFQWTADGNDAVHLSGAIDFSLRPLLGSLADAQAATGPATNVSSAIALAIDCHDLAASLVASTSGQSYSGCDATCTGNLCATALVQRWTSAISAAADGTDSAHMTMTASAPADVGDLAEPSYLEGGWLGSVSNPSGSFLSFAVSGDLIAIEPNGASP